MEAREQSVETPLETVADTPAESGRQQAIPTHSTLREYFVTTVYCTIIALFVTTYVVHPMTVPTPSMEPTILVGDRLLIDKFTFRNGFLPGLPLAPAAEIQRGDIVVFKYPESPETLYVKRAIGLPGEVLEIRDRQVFIDGEPISEPYKVHKDAVHGFGFNAGRDDFGPVTVPPDSYFMMGDNRDDSADSRYFGFLQRDYVVGRPLVVFWSYQDAPNAYLKDSLPEMLGLYFERIVYFFTRTRWSRMGTIVS